MLSKDAHVKGFALSNSLICHSMVFFNPLTYSLYPLTKFLNPITTSFFALLANYNILGQLSKLNTPLIQGKT